MKKIFLLMMGTFLFCICTKNSLYAQRKISISGKPVIRSVLNVNTGDIEPVKVEWKLNGQTIASLKGSSRQGVTVAGGNGQGNAPNQLNYPNGVFVDRDNNVWVADASNGRVQKWAPGATAGVTIGFNLPNRPGFPVNVFVCPRTGAVYVADYFGSRVVRLARNGKQWVTVASGMDLTRGVWVDKNGNVYCTDYGNSRVLKFAPHSSVGQTVAGGNGFGNGLNQFNALTSVMLDEDSNIYVADANNDRVMKWAPGATEGIVVAGGNGEGNHNYQCPFPGHVFVDRQGNVYVSNQSPNNKIQKWAPGATTGKTVAGGNGAGDAANQFNGPLGIFVKGKYLYVVDVANHRVQRFDLSEPNHIAPFTATKPGTYTAVATFEDGSSAVSNSITIGGASSITKTNIYPNPAKSTVTVNYTVQKNGKYMFEITGISGNVLLRKEANAIQGDNRVTLDIGRFVKGVYFVNIIKPDKTRERMQVTKE